jgi:hypothetical protein
MKWFRYILVALILIAFGLVAGEYVREKFSSIEKEKVGNSTVVLERIKQVAKLITVEGNISELYSYKDYYSYDFSPFRKKALIRVNAKVSAGYNFEKMQINVRPDLNIVEINNFPEPEIQSIDHDLDYYDITEGVFNSFRPEDLNKLNDEAKLKIRKTALESNLLVKAKEQKDALIEMLTLLIESSGYSLIINESKPTIPLD